MISSRIFLVTRSSRSFGSTAARPDFMSWFKRNKDTTPAKPVKETKEIISEIESGRDLKAERSTVTRLELSDENFVGIEASEAEKGNRLEALKSVSINKWLSEDKISTGQQLEQVILESYQETYNMVPTEKELSERFADLVSKFKFTKLLQSKSGYMIPDYQLTRLESPEQFRSWFEEKVLSGKLGKFNPAEPNAIDLSAIKFPPNVYVAPDVKLSEKKEKINKIIGEVAAMEQEMERAAIERAKKE